MRLSCRLCGLDLHSMKMTVQPMRLIKTIPIADVTQISFDHPGFVLVWGIDYLKIYKQVR